MQRNVAVTNETLLFEALKKIFSDCVIHQNVQKGIGIKHPVSETYLEYDIWIPLFKLCFEFQDAHHYMTTSYYQLTQAHIKSKDNIKSVMSRKNDFTLVTVPCWWDGAQDSLLSSISFSRPDLAYLFTKPHSPIHLNPPFAFFKDTTIPGVGEVMLASFPPSNFHSLLSSSSWWMGEKYDGVRCCWNSVLKVAYSRYGNELNLMDSIHSKFPSIDIDSELWFGRGQFLYSYSLINGSSHSHWCYLRMIAFDVPSYEYQRLPFEERYKILLKNIYIRDPLCIVVPRTESKEKNIKLFLEEIISFGGEGIILYFKNSFYFPGRSQNIVKLKTTICDQEGIVLSVLKNNSVQLKLANGIIFQIPFQEIFVPKIVTGDIVSFSFETNSRNGGVPINAKIFRIRKDLTWDNVVNSYHSDKRYLNKVSKLQGFTTKETGFWNSSTMRTYMENFAKIRNLDPLISDTWYHSFTEFYKSKSGRIILGKFKNSYFSALQSLFPEITFQESFFSKTDYTKVENRRIFFENYAKKNGFDPLVPNDWYSEPIQDIMAAQGTRSVIFYHGYSVPKALIDLFPNIGLNRFKFNMRQNLWEDKNNRKLFFENYAKDNNFDPLVVDNWYKEPQEKIIATKGAHRVLSYHGNNISTALADLFPNIGLKKSKIQNRLNPWHSAQNRRIFFEYYAKANSFDPLSPGAWYSQSSEKIKNTKGARMVLYYHNKSVSSALMELFPEVHFTRSRLNIDMSKT